MIFRKPLTGSSIKLYFVLNIFCRPYIFPGPVPSYSWFPLNKSFELAVIRDKNYHYCIVFDTESILSLFDRRISIQVYVLDDPNLLHKKLEPETLKVLDSLRSKAVLPAKLDVKRSCRLWHFLLSLSDWKPGRKFNFLLEGTKNEESKVVWSRYVSAV